MAPGCRRRRGFRDLLNHCLQRKEKSYLFQTPILPICTDTMDIWDVAGFDKASTELIGRAGLEHREFPDAMELELGYLIDPDRQGQGLATEVCQAILAFAREELDFPRVNALTDQKNVASVALLWLDTLSGGDRCFRSRTQPYIYEVFLGETIAI